MSTDPLQPLDDPDHPVLTMSQAAELLGVQAAFLRSLDSAGVLHPHRSAGGHRRYSRHQLELAARAVSRWCACSVELVRRRRSSPRRAPFRGLIWTGEGWLP